MHVNEEATAEGTSISLNDQEACLKLCATLGIKEHTSVNGDWFYGAIRHVVRNVDEEAFMGDDAQNDNGWKPRRGDGYALAEILQTIIDTAFPQEVSNR